MRTLLLASIVLAGFAADASAQLIYVNFKTDKDAKRFGEHVVLYKGKPALIGEPKAGITVKDRNVTYTSGAESKNVMWVADGAKPDKVPYEMKDGAKVKTAKGEEVSFPGDVVAQFGMVDELLTLEGVAKEYERRTTEIKDLKDQRDKETKGQKPWFFAHNKMLARGDSLVSWLNNMGFGAAAKKLKGEYERERKVVSKEATSVREKTAMGSVHAIETPPKLIDAAKEITGGKVKYGGFESQHLRIWYHDGIPAAAAQHALETGETVIEGFRKLYVDPYLDDDFVDFIPDEVFAEYFFTPDDKGMYERFYVEFYGLQWDEKHKEERLNSGGTELARGRKNYVGYFKYGKDGDLDGNVVHLLGHFLTDLVYNAGNQGAPQPWLQEALGYYLSFEFLGRNSLTCFSFAEDAYAKAKQEPAKKTVQEGKKGFFNEAALKYGPTIDTLLVKELHELTDADLAKAWSVFDWIARTQGRKGQLWLRLCCMSHRGGDFMKTLRARTEELFEVEPGQDVFQVIEKQWKAYAEKDQMR